jgi:hypothetical protein
MTAPSEKQTAYRATLIRKALDRAKAENFTGVALPEGMTPKDIIMEVNRSASADDWYIKITARTLPGIAFMLALPEPETPADCTEQIISLQVGSGGTYARDHREWAQPILDRLTSAWGDYMERAPKVATVADVRAIATGVSNG